MADHTRLKYEFKTYRGRITPAELRCWLDLHGLTQADLAHALGTTPRTVNAWCRGKNRTPLGLHDELAKRYGKPYPPADTLFESRWC
jgi:transcriptional regulator with XRE-family HTH domain